MSKQIAAIQEVSWHRNGVAGEGFHAIRFTVNIEAVSPDEAKRWCVTEAPARPAANFLGIVFDGRGQCAVICLDYIAEHGVKFGANSWRGDNYEGELREAIETHRSSGSVRVGPFGLPVG